MFLCSLIVSHVPWTSNHKTEFARFTLDLDTGHTSYQSTNEAQGCQFTNFMADADCPVKVSRLMMTSAAQATLRPWGVSRVQHWRRTIGSISCTRDWTVRFLSLIHMPRQAGPRAGRRENVVPAGGVIGAEHPRSRMDLRPCQMTSDHSLGKHAWPEKALLLHIKLKWLKLNTWKVKEKQNRVWMIVVRKITSGWFGLCV